DLKREFAGKQTKFLGYDSLRGAKCKVLAIVQNGKLVKSADKGEAVILLDQTSFYAESGGQVGDKGVIVKEFGPGVTRNDVLDVQKHEGLILHRMFLREILNIGEEVDT